AALVAGARALGRSGVDLKDTSRQELDTATVVSLEPADPDT
nr:ethanolamine ammonia-lyase [Gordonia sp. (in: high G+C Gram-positive bacteria)]